MASLGNTFDVNNIPDDSNFEPLPAGWYTAQISSSELCTTKAGTGQYIKLCLDVTGPSHAGRKVFTNLNIRNPNQVAEEIGIKQLGQIGRSIGVPRISDTDQLIGGALQIKVTVKNDPQYGPGNEVRGYKAVGGSQAPAPDAYPQQAPAAQQAPTPQQGGSPPWAQQQAQQAPAQPPTGNRPPWAPQG